jgi:mercuric reductase
VETLARQALITLDAKGEIHGAYPFTMDPRMHRVHMNGLVVHAMCALDALAPSAMFSCQSSIHSRCAVSQQSISIEMEGDSIGNKAQCGETHVGINWQAASDTNTCADSLCLEMLFLRDSETAQQWATANSSHRETFTLDEAVTFAKHFFCPLMAVAE